MLTKPCKKKIRDGSENVLKDFQEVSDDVRLQNVLKSIFHRKVVTCRPFYASTPQRSNALEEIATLDLLERLKLRKWFLRLFKDCGPMKQVMEIKELLDFKGLFRLNQ